MVGRYLGNLSKSLLNRGATNRVAAVAGARDFLTGMSGYSSMTRATAYGGAAGAAWGAVSNDTSVIGGGLMGAGALRYGLRGKNIANAASKVGLDRASQIGYGLVGAAKFARRDVKRAGAALVSNAPVRRLRSSLKGWGTGIGGVL